MSQTHSIDLNFSSPSSSLFKVNSQPFQIAQEPELKEEKPATEPENKEEKAPAESSEPKAGENPESSEPKAEEKAGEKTESSEPKAEEKTVENPESSEPKAEEKKEGETGESETESVYVPTIDQASENIVYIGIFLLAAAILTVIGIWIKRTPR